MVKNALLSLKKNIGKTILLFIIMFVIANLVLAGFSIQNASSRSIDTIKNSMGNEVTLSVDFRNMMQNRQPGEAIDNSSNLTSEMADQLLDLNHVENYNYNLQVNVDSSLTAVVSESETSDENSNFFMGGNMDQNTSDFTIQANTTMQYLSDFTNENYQLIEGRLLSTDDYQTNNCVIETNLALENNLSIGDTFTITTANDSNNSVAVTIVGIYEIVSTGMSIQMDFSNPVNTIYADISLGQTLNGNNGISSASYYLDDVENIEAFIEEAKETSDIDFDVYSLQSQDQLFQSNAGNIDNITSFTTLFLIVVISAGSLILILILALTIRNRYYEIGVFLSLGQSKIKIILQQMLEIGIIALIAFVISLGTGRLTANIISGMLSNQSQEMAMSMDEKNQMPDNPGGNFDFNNALQRPEEQFDVAITTNDVVKLGLTTSGIVVISTMIPVIYILRLSPRQILMKKEG